MNIKTPKEVLIETMFPNIGITKETELWFECWSVSDDVIKAMETYKNQFNNENKEKGTT